jgi:hypothetical protein
MRQTRMHHIQLSSMADMKASMLLTIASVVTTLSAPYLSDPRLRWSAAMLIAFSTITVVLAAYAVMPKMPMFTRPPMRPETGSPAFNLLFFGDFVGMAYDDYEKAMEEVMNDPSRTYEVQVREIYMLGTFLAKKKYRFLRLAYLAFIGGMMVSGAALMLQNVIG